MTANVLTDEQIESALISAGYLRADFKLTTQALANSRAIEQAVLQSPEVQAWKKDAERYRHLRDEAELCPHDIFNAWWLSDHGNPQTLDAAIDTAMQEQKT